MTTSSRGPETGSGAADGAQDDPTGDGRDGRDGAESIGYAAAVEELETILAALERDDLDIDVLGPQVQRAAALIRLCRDRIDVARHEVEQIVADLDDTTAGGEAEVG